MDVPCGNVNAVTHLLTNPGSRGQLHTGGGIRKPSINLNVLRSYFVHDALILSSSKKHLRRCTFVHPPRCPGFGHRRCRESGDGQHGTCWVQSDWAGETSSFGAKPIQLMGPTGGVLIIQIIGLHRMLWKIECIHFEKEKCQIFCSAKWGVQFSNL